MNGVSLQAAKIQLSNNGGNNPNLHRKEDKYKCLIILRQAS